MIRSLLVAPTGQPPTISAIFCLWIDCCPTNTNNPAKQSFRRRASFRLLPPTIQPIHLRNNGPARLARSEIVAGIVDGPISVTNPGSGFDRCPRWSLGLRSVSVMNANAKPSRIRTGTCQRCKRDPVTLRAERHESMASSVRSTP